MLSAVTITTNNGKPVDHPRQKYRLLARIKLSELQTFRHTRTSSTHGYRTVRHHRVVGGEDMEEIRNVAKARGVAVVFVAPVIRQAMGRAFAKISMMRLAMCISDYYVNKYLRILRSMPLRSCWSLVTGGMAWANPTSQGGGNTADVAEKLQPAHNQPGRFSIEYNWRADLANGHTIWEWRSLETSKEWAASLIEAQKRSTISRLSNRMFQGR